MGRREDYYVDKLLDLAFEFRDDGNTCEHGCYGCPLNITLSGYRGEFDLCDILVGLCNDESKFEKETK